MISVIKFYKNSNLDDSDFLKIYYRSFSVYLGFKIIRRVLNLRFKFVLLRNYFLLYGMYG